MVPQICHQRGRAAGKTPITCPDHIRGSGPWRWVKARELKYLSWSSGGELSFPFRSVSREYLNEVAPSVCVTGLETESTLERRAPCDGHCRSLQSRPPNQNSSCMHAVLRRLPGATPSRPAASYPACGSCAEPLWCLLDAPPTLCHFIGERATRLRNNSIPGRGVNYATALGCSRS